MPTGEILYAVLLGVILVWVADIFHLWDVWASALTRWFNTLRGRGSDAS
jgi:hypothetical protein